jgi:hypothetical protein
VPSRNRSNLPDMASLTAAHRGYEYRDLLVTCRLVHMWLVTVLGQRGLGILGGKLDARNKEGRNTDR